MTIEESIGLQRHIADFQISEDDAVRLLMEKAGMAARKARFRVRMSRGQISPEQAVPESHGRGAMIANAQSGAETGVYFPVCLDKSGLRRMGDWPVAGSTASIQGWAPERIGPRAGRMPSSVQSSDLALAA